MGFCGRNACWMLCGGEYKLLLRSAWIVLIMTTLIDITALAAYWKLAPRSLDSKSGGTLSLLLLIALQFQYFFADVLGLFILLKLFPDEHDSPRRSTAMNNHGAIDGPVSSYGYPSSMTYCDGLRHALPNNVTPSPPYRDSWRQIPVTEIQEASNRRTDITENAGLNLRDRNSNLNDGKLNQNNQSDASLDQVVPEIVITEPEDAVPAHNAQAQQSRFSRRTQRYSFTRAMSNGDYLKASPGSFFHSTEVSKFNKEKQSKDIPMLQQEANANNTDSSSKVKPVSGEFKGDVNNIAYGYYDDQRQTWKTAMQQSEIDTSLTVKPINSRCRNYIYDSGDKQTFEMSTYQTKINSGTSNDNHTARPVSFRSESRINRCDANLCNADKELNSKMYMHHEKTHSKRTNSDPSIKIKRSRRAGSRNSDSYVTKSQSFIDQYKRCAADKPPSTTNSGTAEAELLFEAAVGCENIFKNAYKKQTGNDEDGSLKDVVVMI